MNRMSDTISRQTAIAYAISGKTREFDGDKWIRVSEVRESLKTMPSAQPSEIQDILDYLDTTLHPIVSPEHWNVYAELHDMISMLPSTQSERKTGHWIEITSSNHTYKCSVCGRLLVNITDGKNNVAKNYPYCHCGADMRGEENE